MSLWFEIYRRYRRNRSILLYIIAHLCYKASAACPKQDIYGYSRVYEGIKNISAVGAALRRLSHVRTHHRLNQVYAFFY